MNTTHADCDHGNDYCQVAMSASIDQSAAREHAAKMRAALAAWDAEWSVTA